MLYVLCCCSTGLRVRLFESLPTVLALGMTPPLGGDYLLIVCAAVLTYCDFDTMLLFQQRMICAWIVATG